MKTRSIFANECSNLKVSVEQKRSPRERLERYLETEMEGLRCEQEAMAAFLVDVKNSGLTADSVKTIHTLIMHVRNCDRY